MDFINKSVEFIKELLLFFHEIFVLLQSDFILPLNFFIRLVIVSNLLLSLIEFSHDFVVLNFLLKKEVDFIILARFFASKRPQTRFIASVGAQVPDKSLNAIFLKALKRLVNDKY